MDMLHAITGPGSKYKGAPIVLCRAYRALLSGHFMRCSTHIVLYGNPYTGWVTLSNLLHPKMGLARGSHMTRNQNTMFIFYLLDSRILL